MAPFSHCDEARAALTQVSRVGASVVAPTLGPARLLQALRERIDAVFLPRPLLFVARLPRNGTGKLPQEALRALAGAHREASGRLDGAHRTPVTFTRPSGACGALPWPADPARRVAPR